MLPLRALVADVRHTGGNNMTWIIVIILILGGLLACAVCMGAGGNDYHIGE